MPIILMICFARSGGTILNQCLGSLPDVVMMSEVNPLGGGIGKEPISYQTIKLQAKNWYDINLNSDEENFEESTLELSGLCEKKGKKLIIRDFTSINFVPFEPNNYNPPQRLLSLETLQDKCKLISFAFVRDAIDVYISFKSRWEYDLEKFFEYYLTYVRSIIDLNIAIFTYEDFTQEPSNTLRNICSYTGLQYSSSFKNFKTFKKVNGDVQFTNPSRGTRKNTIETISRRIIPKEEIMAINRCVKMVEANNLLGYPTSYEGRIREKLYQKIVNDVQGKIKKNSSRLSRRLLRQ
ncbi:hypothetical protein ACFLRX_10000 [Acidobacteriota bacterium]